MKHGLSRNIKTSQNLDVIVVDGTEAKNMFSGWSSITSALVVYKIYGGMLFITVNVNGTSNATTASVSINIPFNLQNVMTNQENVGASTIYHRGQARVSNNGGAAVAGASRCLLFPQKVQLEYFNGVGNFTASGTKTVVAQHMIPIG